jgi:membrane-bound serine protease (ClpP class)
MKDVILFMILGIVLLGLDLFVPGIVLSVAGTFAFLAATATAFRDFGVLGGLGAFVVGMSLLGVMLWVEYGVLPKTKAGRRFFLDAAVPDAGAKRSADLAALTGREGVVITPLVPTGQIEIEGRRHEARSLDGRLPAGARVRVAGLENFTLIVNQLS